MKKSFISLFLLSLLTVFGSLSVKADDLYVRNFGYQDNQWTQTSSEGQTSCAGNISPMDKIITGSDFYFSGRHDDAFKRSDNEWTGVNGANNNHAGVKACTRESKTVSLSAGTYTFKLLSKNTESATLTLPKIILGSDEYTVTDIIVDESSQSFSNNQYYYIGGKETTLCYGITLSSAYNGTVSVEFKDGWKEKYLFKSLTITPATPACSGETVTVVADNDDHGTVTGSGSYCANARVDIAATPNDHYSFVNWTVTSGPASLNDASSASTYFTMSDPAAAVTVQANFEYTPCTKTKVIQCEDYDNSHVCGSTPVPSTLRINSDHTGYAHDDYPKWHGSGFADFQEHNTGGQIFFPITLPAGTYTFSVICANGGDKKIRIYNSSCSKVVDDISLSNDWGGSGWVTATTPAQTLDAGDYYISLYASNRYAAFDQITISATSNVFCPNTITMAKSGDASADDPTSSPASAAMAGTKVTITAGEASANHNFSGWTVLPEYAVTFDAPASPTTTFVMPAVDVTITANYEVSVASALTFRAVEGGIVSATAGGNAISSGAEVLSGTSVTLTAEANSNYVFINWTDDNDGDEVVSTNAAFTFSMPATATSYTANFAQIDNVISQGSETGSSGEYHEGATMTESHIDDFGTFGHNVLKLSYSDMTNGNYHGWNIGKNGSYSSANSAGATGFGFYYKTETNADKVAFCFDHGDPDHQYKVELPATNNVWKYHYFDQPAANGWNGSNIIIYINGTDGGNTTANANGAIYLADIAATSIIMKDDIASYTYTREKASNSYGTLCLPMDGSVSGATLYSVAGKQEEGGKLYIVLEEQDANLAAGEPYIFETDGSPLTATMSGPHSAVHEDANGLVGTYQQITAPVYNGSDNLNYILALDNSGNTVFKKVGENVTVGAYRAYINIHNAGDYSPASAAPGRKYIRFGIEGTEEAQAVEMIYDDASLRTRKIMQNGHLYILRDGHLFTAQGTQIK